MCASPLKIFTEGPPPPRVVLLPDALFFSRSLPVSTEAAEETVRASEAATQIELAFETLAPFPLAQLYYGYFWVDGSPRALAFAAYRRRFTTEQTDAWHNAELVLPAFASILRAPMTPASTVVLHAPEGLTAIHWADGPVPLRVIFRPLAAEATDDDRAQTRDALLRNFESKTIVDLAEPPVVGPTDGDGSYIFRAGELVSTFTPAESSSLDVRDKDELAALRRARRRDIMMWRTVLACVAAFVLLGIGELALIGGGLWQTTRKVRLNAQAPMVEQIASENDIATRIEDLRTKRLLTVEMLYAVMPKKPEATYFTVVNTTTGNLYTLTGEGQTPNPAEISVFQDALNHLPQVESVSMKTMGVRGNMATFRVTITFKPNSLKALSS